MKVWILMWGNLPCTESGFALTGWHESDVVTGTTHLWLDREVLLNEWEAEIPTSFNLPRQGAWWVMEIDI